MVFVNQFKIVNLKTYREREREIDEKPKRFREEALCSLFED